MKIEKAIELCKKELELNGLGEWLVITNNSKKVAGSCSYPDKYSYYPNRGTIELSRMVIPIMKDEGVIDTIRHEIAHALVGPGHKHDDVWEIVCISIGGSSNRHWGNDDMAVDPETTYKWVGICPSGHKHFAHRRGSNKVSCGKCSNKFNIEHLIDWRLNEKNVKI